MDANERQRYRQVLLIKLGELTAQQPKAESVIPSAGDRHGDSADQASSDIEADLQIQLHQTNGRLVRAINGALIRLKEGTFGTCVTCNRPISKARLKVVPWTHECLACKEKRDD